MAYTSSIDELNNLQTEQDRQKIRDYFEEMDLEPEEIEKRIGVANGLDNLYLMLFLLMSASATAGESVIDDNEYWNDYLTRGYNDVLGENGYDTDDPMVSGRIDETVNEVLNTTYEHIAQSYYLSHDRAVMIASNDTNAFANYEQHIQAIKAGYTRKRWVAMRDRKVRHTHVWADGQEADIQKPFIVGGYEMLFPLDQSLGADAKEVVGCRCAVRYLDRNGKEENGVEILEKTDVNTNSIPRPNLKSMSKNDRIALRKQAHREANVRFVNESEIRYQEFGDEWASGSLKKTLKELNAVYTKTTDNGKKIYVSQNSSLQVVYDKYARYYRVEDTAIKGKRKYIGADLKKVPNNVTDEHGVQHGMSSKQYQMLTHIKNTDYYGTP